METTDVDRIGNCEQCGKRTHSMAFNLVHRHYEYLCLTCQSGSGMGEYGDQIE